ncbi:3-ketoacyl-ACP reductase [Ulvibacterium sp.]|uniref:3-ketoacyl-ACP reductase n=1 Tax=Ulvibacterium sp. TaxID=2665914 RepID=UPI002635992E|nr:3-ketoacyl-ACP reductase [Ulvibacterium sp.]
MTKNVLITGGSRGIGLGIARELAKAGCNLAINGIREANNIIKVLEELKGLGAQKVIYCQGNIAIAQDRSKVIEEVLGTFEQLHVLVNNAGVGPLKRLDLLETTEESYDRVMDINLKGPFFLTQKVADHMIQHKDRDKENVPCIINISSISATTASINRGEYCLSKAGLSMMTQLFATKLGEFGIPVYEVRPGVIETDMTAKVLRKYQEMIDMGLTLQSRIGSPEDVGKAVLALVEGRFPYSTGQVIMVDGGLTTPRL